MREKMLNHGLEQPVIGTDTGYFHVTFLVPGSNVECIRAPETRLLVTPSIEVQLNERQRKIILDVLENGKVTGSWCLRQFGVVYNASYRDLNALVTLGILKQEGRGRGTRYTLLERR